VAEIIEGSQIHVVMVRAGLVHGANETSHPRYAVALKYETVWSDLGLALPHIGPDHWSEVLAAGDWGQGLVVVDEVEVAYSTYDLGRWHRWTHVPIPRKGVQSRDPRSMVVPSSDGKGFDAYVGASMCSGTMDAGGLASEVKIQCHASDDPWPIAQAGAGSPQLKAFYNGSRDYFTGVVTPSVGEDLPAFYSAALVPRAMGAWALVIGGIDGKVQVAENGTLKAVSGTRDWGSDFAAMQSGCGAGTQIVASGAGGAVGGDSLRAYEVPAQDAMAVSAPLSVNGTVMALSTAEDGKSVYAVVRIAGAAGQGESYEVDRVTASCN
jgi:hypothetical protein